VSGTRSTQWEMINEYRILFGKREEERTFWIYIYIYIHTRARVGGRIRVLIGFIWLGLGSSGERVSFSAGCVLASQGFFSIQLI
jgi:hypothetical protein